MSLWGLLAQGIQDTIGHIGGLATGTHPWQVQNKQMQQAEQLQQHGMNLDEKNYQHMLDKFKYDKDIQQQIFRREDTAVQRRTEDLRNAGINPLLAAGQAAGAGSPIGVTAPMHQATGAIAGMSAKQQARALAVDYYNQQRARSVQISQIAAHAELLREQAATERERQNELRSLSAEQTERTKNYAWARTLDAWEIHEIASKLRINEKQLQKINADTEKVKLDTDERKYNWEKAKSLGIRSDVNPTLVGELTQALYALMHAREKYTYEKIKEDFLTKNPGIKDFFDAIKPGDEATTIQGLLDGIAERQRLQLERQRNIREYSNPLGNPNID